MNDADRNAAIVASTIIGINGHVGLRTLAESMGIEPSDLDVLEQVAFSREDREITASREAMIRLADAGLVFVTWHPTGVWLRANPKPAAFGVMKLIRSVRTINGRLDSEACL